MQPPTIQQTLETALQFHRAGRLGEAEALYRQILAQDPNHADALHFLGVIAHQIGRNDLAVDLIRRAIALNPSVADYHSNFGVVLKAIDQLDAAIAACRRAIEIKPDYAEAHNNLGNALIDRGETEEAVAACRRAIDIKPGYADAHNNLGIALKGTGKFEEAIAEYRRVLQLKPDYAEAHNNLGNALIDQGQLDEAVASCRRAIQLKPDYVEAHMNLGNALTNQGQLDEAIAAYHRALQIKPDFAAAYSNLATALKEQGRIDEAIAAYRRAIQLAPDNSMVHSNLLLGLHYLPDFDAEALFQEHRSWDRIHAQPLAKAIEPHGNDRNPERRLRVGYVSPDFRDHSVAFFLEALLASHDRDRVEVFCYADTFRPDPVTARLRSHADTWRSITGIPDAQAAGLIRKDGIDLLVDLTGHTAHNRLTLFARKPAPVQVTWLGYPGTTGMSVMDYRLTDAHADPPGTTEHLHSEQLVRLPEVSAGFRPFEDSPLVGPLPAASRGHVTFASFHTLAKLNERLLDWWARILLQVPGSRLMLVAAGVNEGAGRQRLRDFFTSKGVAVGRLEFRERKSLPRFFALHDEVDVMLDSFPFTGHTISCHALWMGVPVVTLAGDRHCSRMVTSVLTNLGLPEWIARTPDEYVNIASDIAGDLPRLAEMRAGLRERMRASPLTDGPRFARNVEQAYREMWRAWCANKPPES